jgi:2-keto-4-pentenoate hydratase/2-oxohepta-3-ene-1,7-dioic acid hydratase in catechol pathway
VNDTLRIESRQVDGGFTSTLRSGAASRDLGAGLLAFGDVRWNPRIETPLDALLQSGSFGARIADLAASAANAAPERLPGPLVAPVVRPRKILALGRTYREHAFELGNAPPAEPLVFDKLPATLAGSGEVVAVPGRAGGRMDHEAELALVIGTRARALPNGNGRAAVAAVTIANDLTLRGVQKAAQKAGHPWLLAKNFPGSCVLGPWITPVGPEAPLDRLEIVCRVNGDVRQRASTAGLLRTVGGLVEWISQWIPLDPGDVILTGTPAGTGPLVAGDVCEITISGDNLDLGTLVTTVA